MNTGSTGPTEQTAASVPNREPPFVADSGRLIALARIEKLSLLERLFGSGLIPPAVHREIGVHSGRPGATLIGQALSAGWLQIVHPEDEGRVASLARIVDAGEAEAVAVCLQQKVRFLLIDDAKGRKVARRAGIPLVGVAGILLAAKARGLLVAVGPMLEDLIDVGYRLSLQLVDGVRRTAGE